MGQLRQVLKLAKVPDVSCTSRDQLKARLKQVEARSRNGACDSVAQLLEKAGLAAKRPRSAASSSSAEQPAPKRPSRLRRGVSYVEKDEEDEEDEEGMLTDGSAAAEECEPASGNGLINRKVELQRSRKWRVGTITAYNPKSRQHRVAFSDGGDEWVVLSEVKWKFHQAQRAPGTQGAARSGAAKKRRVAESSDDESGENAPPQRNPAPPGGARRGRGKTKVVDDSDSASAWGGSSGEEEEEEEEDGEGELSDWSGGSAPKTKRTKGGRASAAAKGRASGRASSSASGRSSALSSKARGKRPAARDDSDVDSLLGDDGVGDEAHDPRGAQDFQHADLQQIKHLQRLKKQLLRKLDQLSLPDNPLDQLVFSLGGPSCVAEMTGRKGRLVRDDSGKTVYQRRNVGERDAATGKAVSMENINLKERESFMEGRKCGSATLFRPQSPASLPAPLPVPAPAPAPAP